MCMQLKTEKKKLCRNQSEIARKSARHDGKPIFSISKSLKLLWRSIFILSMIIWSLVGTLPAQVKQHTDNNADQTLRSNGRINPSSFGLEIDIPLGAYPGRGINVPVSISYSSKVWRMDFQSSEPVNPGCTSVWDPKYSEDSASGWTSTMGAAYIEYTGEDNIFDATYGKPISDACDPQNPVTTYAYFKRIQIHLPSGESHELRAGDAPATYSATDPNYVKDMAGTYYSVDGSKLKYVENTTTKRLYLPNGSYYDFAAGKTTLNQKTIRKAALYKDVNGNPLTYYDGNTTYPNGYWTDTLNRTIPVPLPIKEPTSTGVVDYNMPGFNGGTLLYKFHWKQLKAGTAAESGLTNFYQSLRYKGDFYDLNSAYRNVDEALFHSEFRNRARSLSSEPVFNPIVLTAVELPNGQKYEFSYNIYGEIEHIKYPTGGVEDFQFSTVIAVGAFDNNKPNEEANRGVSQRSIYETSGAAPSVWSYSSNKAGTTLTRIVNAPDNTRSERDLYMGDAPGGQFGSWGFNNVLVGMAFEERSYAANSGPILGKQKTTWAKTEFTMTNSSVNPQWHPRVTKVEAIIYDLSGNALSSSTTMEYAGTLTEIDNHLDVNLSKQYGYTTSLGSLGALEKQIETVFMEYDGLISQADKDAYENNHLISLPTQTFIKNAAQTTIAKSEIKYDETSYGGGGYRGQPTRVRNWLDTNNSWIEARSKYDGYGNVIETTDAKGNISQIQYTDNFSDGQNHNALAFPTKTISVVPDPSGANGSNTAFESTIKYDFTTGLPISTTDANGQISAIEYNDPLLRPTKSIAPNGHQTITEYGAGTSAATRYVKVRTQIDEQKWKEGYTWYDGLGRTIKSQSVDSQGDVFVETEYDTMGRAKKATNPFRTGETKLWTESFFDDLGRVTKVKTPDNAEVNTAYSIGTGTTVGTVVTVTDQASKQRRSITNALGQLKRIDEPTDAGGLGAIDSANQSTSYTYDILNNLTTVTQGSQTRSFVYDSLSRLKQAQNPESGLIQYAYDNNGNLTSKIDARNFTTTYAYDNLNRVKTRSYSDGTTPAVSYFYDNLTNAKGKLIKVSSNVSETRYTAFDQMGRVTASEQRTPFIDTETIATATPRTSSYTYNLSGALVEQTYPSGRIVKNVLDADGDLSQVKSKKNQNSGFFNYAKSFTYTSAGAVSSMQLGNGKWESAIFNNRLQPTQIALGTVQNGTDKLKLNYSYGGTDNNGNVQSQTITVPTVGANTGFTAVQSYTYDSVNRLKSATENIGTQTWKQTFLYDRYGNRNFDTTNNNTTTLGTCATNVCNPTLSVSNNRFTSGQGYTYDLAGNVITDAQGRTFAYDAENKQKSVSGTGGTIGTYLYDGDGKRVKKVTSTETTIFVYDAAGKLVAEYSNQISSIPQVSYLTSDNLGSPRITTDANGNVFSRRDFHPFGEEVFTAQRTQGLGYAADTVRQKFTSYERDNESDLDFAQARMYSSRLGRFYSVDPENAGASADNPQTWNAYAYVGNNPINITDPTGLSWYFNKEQNSYRWYEDDQTPGEGYVSVVGNNGQAGSFSYEAQDGTFVTLDPYSNNYQTNIASQADAIKLADRLYQLDPRKREFAAGYNKNYDRNMNIVTAMAIASGIVIAAPVIADVALAGGANKLIQLGLTETAVAAPTGVAALNQLVNQAQNISKSGSNWTQLTTRGNPQQIFDSITQGGQKMAKGVVKLSDGTIVKLYDSTTKGQYQGPTIHVNQAGAITKIRITQ